MIKAQKLFSPVLETFGWDMPSDTLPPYDILLALVTGPTVLLQSVSWFFNIPIDICLLIILLFIQVDKAIGKVEI